MKTRTITTLFIAVVLSLIVATSTFAQDENEEQMAMWSYCVDTYGLEGASICYDQQEKAALAVLLIETMALDPKLKGLVTIINACSDAYSFVHKDAELFDYVKILDCIEESTKSKGSLSTTNM